MMNKTKFLITSLFGIAAVCPAVADTVATEKWVKGYTYKKATVDTAVGTLNSHFIDVRDNVYMYDLNNHGGVLNPLHTAGQNAFSGINEVLEKVDGNNGTSGSAATLNTTAKNAFGAINELKVEIDGKVSTADLNSAVSDAIGSQIGNDLNTIYDTATETRKSVAIVDNFTAQDLQNIQSITE